MFAPLDIEHARRLSMLTQLDELSFPLGDDLPDGASVLRQFQNLKRLKLSVSSDELLEDIAENTKAVPFVEVRSRNGVTSIRHGIIEGRAVK